METRLDERRMADLRGAATASDARGAAPIHFGPPSRLRFGWVHPPAGIEPRGAGVVLCNTLGNESLRAYGTLRHLAEQLARAGLAALRVDFHGTGDSGGGEADPDRLSTWLEDIDLSIEELRARCGCRVIGLAGLRMGATLALLAAARRTDVESLLLWDPYLRGGDFVTEATRMHKALAMLEPSGFALERPEGDDPGGVEALGFLLSHAALAELRSVDLLAVERRPARRVLLVGAARASKSGGGALTGHLGALGAEVEQQVLPEHMNRNLRLVRAEDHARIAADMTRWLSARLGPGAPGAGGIDVPGDPSPAPAPRCPGDGERREIDEEPIFLGERGAVFGIVTRPERARVDDERPAIILVNAGPGTRIGPHRQYVRMARAWARLGFLVLRMDLSGSGDSAGAGAAENDPYPPQAVGDVQAAMTLLQERFSARRFIVAGICSGADIAFRTALAEPRVAGAWIINPRTFALRDIPDLEQRVHARALGATLASRRNWQNLLRGRAGLAGSLLRISQVLRAAAFRVTRWVSTALGRPDPQGQAVDVPREVRRLLDRGVDTLLVVRDRDDGISYVESFFRREMAALEGRAGFRRVTFRGTDHLFTLLRAQDLLLETLTEHLLGTHPGARRPPRASAAPAGPAERPSRTPSRSRSSLPPARAASSTARSPGPAPRPRPAG